MASFNRTSLQPPPPSQNSCLPTIGKALVLSTITLIALGGIAALTIGLLGRLEIISGINSMAQGSLIGAGALLEILFVGGLIFLRKSPYSFSNTLSFLANYLSNGFFSENPYPSDVKFLEKEGFLSSSNKKATHSVKILFLGDVMVSKSGKLPKPDARLKALLKSAQVIVANVESPVVDSTQVKKRGLFSLRFEMNAAYLKSLYDYNPNAKWVFSIANNHACDTSDKNEKDVSGVLKTIESIRAALPQAEIIGARIGKAKPVLSFHIGQSPKIKIVGWTEVMNNDHLHSKKKIMREKDVTEEKIKRLKKRNTLLIGFAHGNVEQSRFPLKETRKRWLQLMGRKKFDILVGHGPHVIQPSERVGKTGLLFSSIGNFCSPSGPSQTRIGCIPEIDIGFNDDGRSTDLHYKINLLEQQREKNKIRLLKKDPCITPFTC